MPGLRGPLPRLLPPGPPPGRPPGPPPGPPPGLPPGPPPRGPPPRLPPPAPPGEAFDFHYKNYKNLAAIYFICFKTFLHFNMLN